MLGSWNKLVVVAAKVAPAVLSHYAARTGVSSQQTSEPRAPDRPSNLFEPVDVEEDHGADGRFDHRATGVVDRRFLQSLPESGRQLAVAVRAAGREKLTRLAPWAHGA